MILDFPPSPIIGTIYVGDNGVSYVYDGIRWTGTLDNPGPQGPSGPSGPTSYTATNILGGSTGSILIQTSPGLTSFIPIGPEGYILQSDGTTATWVNTTTIFDPDISANQIFINTVTNEVSTTQFLVFTDQAGIYNQVGINDLLNFNPETSTLSASKLNILSSDISDSTFSGSLIVVGGVGIGQNLYLGNDLYVYNNAVFGVYTTTNYVSGYDKYLLINGIQSDQNVGIAELELRGGNSSSSGVQSVINFISNATDNSDYNSARIEVTNSLNDTNFGVMKFYTRGGLGAGTLTEGAILDENQRLTLLSSENSTSTTTGALVVTGGAGVGLDLFIGGDLNIVGSIFQNGAPIIGAAAGTDQQVQYNDNGNLSGSDKFKFDNSNSNLIIDGSVIASNEFLFGDVVGDSYSRLRMLSTSSAYGFTFTDLEGTALINEDSTQNQALVLGDSGQNSTGTIFGVSILEGPGTPTTGEENWIKKLELVGTGDLRVPTGNLDVALEVKASTLRLNSSTEDISTGFHGIYFADGTYQWTSSEGISGPTGPQGPEGPQGPQGPGADQELNTTSNVTFSGVSVFGNITVKNIYETIVTISSATGIVNHDYGEAAIFNHINIESTFTCNIINLNLPVDRATNIVLVLNQTSTAYIPEALQIDNTNTVIYWQGNITPIGNPDRKDIISFSLLNDGVSILALGQLVTFG
jgi:hypothetical protein